MDRTRFSLLCQCCPLKARKKDDRCFATRIEKIIWLCTKLNIWKSILVLKVIQIVMKDAIRKISIEIFVWCYLYSLVFCSVSLRFALPHSFCFFLSTCVLLFYYKSNFQQNLKNTHNFYCWYYWSSEYEFTL